MHCPNHKVIKPLALTAVESALSILKEQPFAELTAVDAVDVINRALKVTEDRWVIWADEAFAKHTSQDAPAKYKRLREEHSEEFRYILIQTWKEKLAELEEIAGDAI